MIERLTHDLVDLSLVAPRILLDIRYATKNNFLNTAVYTIAKCWLHKEAAMALAAVQEELEGQGLGVKVFDGYRPLPVQQLLWDKVQDEKYVSNPAINKGRHTRGTAVDLTLVDANGQELEMATAFDDFTDKAHSNATVGISANAIKNRTLLQKVMVKHGFEIYPFEWWHFDLAGWKNDQKYPPLCIDFEKLAQNPLI